MTFLSDNSYDELAVVEELEPSTSDDGDSEEGSDDHLVREKSIKSQVNA